DQQRQVADEIVERKLSIKETRRLIRQLGAHSGARPKKAGSAPSPEDPLAAVWPDVRSATAMSQVWWDAEYGQHKLPTGDKISGWFFFASPIDSQEQKACLAEWFREMAQALQDGSADRRIGVSANNTNAETLSRPIAEPVVTPIRPIAEPPTQEVKPRL